LGIRSFGGGRKDKKDFDNRPNVGRLMEVASKQHRKKRNKFFDSRRSPDNLGASQQSSERPS
jgi:hypothetical protein